MTRKSFYITLLILGLLFLIQHVLIKQPDILKKKEASENFADIEITLLDGGFEPLGYYEGKKPVILVFWNSTSNPSHLALDEIGEDVEKWREDYEFEIIAVNVGESVEDIAQAKELWNIDMKIGLDPNNEITKEFGVGALPAAIFINKEGEIQKRWDGMHEDIDYGIRRQLRGDEDETTTKITKDEHGDTIKVEVKSGDSIISVDTIKKDD